MQQSTWKGLLAPAFMALGIAAGVLDLHTGSVVMGRLALGAVLVGLLWAPFTRAHLLESARILRR